MNSYFLISKIKNNGCSFNALQIKKEARTCPTYSNKTILMIKMSIKIDKNLTKPIFSSQPKTFIYHFFFFKHVVFTSLHNIMSAITSVARLRVKKATNKELSDKVGRDYRCSHLD